MATNKTIAPTGVTVQIPALTDTPDMSVPANAIDKAIDGINALNSQKANVDKVFKNSQYAESQTLQIELPYDIANGQAYLIVFRHYTSASTFTADLMVLSGLGSNSVATAWVAKNSSATLQSTSVSGDTVTFTFSAKAYASIYFIRMN